MWTYEQSTGRLLRDGQFVAVGYSGRAEGKNQPSMEDIHGVGPIPRGRWLIGPAFDSSLHGPLCLPLIPRPGTNTHGRIGFLIHGDSLQHPGEASEGCIIMPHEIRERIVDSQDHALNVTDGESHEMPTAV